MNNADAILLSICKEAAAANFSKTQKSAFVGAFKEAVIRFSPVDGPFFDHNVRWPDVPGLCYGPRRDTKAAIYDRVSDSIVSRRFDENGNFEGYQWGPLVESYAWAKHNEA